MEFGQVFAFLTSVSVIFLIFVCPLWIIMHYSAKKRESKTLLEEESESLNRLLDTADRMEQRLDALEKILEAEDPNWKDQVQ